MIELKDFSTGYDGKNILENINTEFIRGSLTALIGRNGSGKSTLLKVLGGLKSDYLGSVFLNKKEIRDLNRAKMAKEVSIVTSHRPSLPNLTCREIVALGRSPYTDWLGKIDIEDSRRIEEALEDTGMKEFSNRKIESLSDGEAQRIMIARALAQDTSVIVLDEPTSFLDMPARYETAELLLNLARDKNKTIIFSTHELDLALNVCDFVALISDKKLINLPPEKITEGRYIQNLFSSKSKFFNSAIWNKN